MKAETPKFTTVDDYIAFFPAETRARLIQIRQLVHKVVPEAEEKISYGMPAYKFNGAQRFYFGGYDSHIGIYGPNLSSLGLDKELEPYRSAKATLRFELDQPLPLDLIERILKAQASS